MALLTTDVAVSPIGQSDLMQLVDGQSSAIGVRLELRGVAATSSASACRVVCGASSVDLVTTHSTAGLVTATLTGSDLDTLGASAEALSRITAWWSGTVTDGASSRQWRCQQQMVVTDRALHHAVLFDDLAIELPVLRRSETIPTGQTSHWDAIGKHLRSFNRELDTRGGSVRSWLIQHPEQMTPLVEAYVLFRLALSLCGADNGQSRSLEMQARRWERETERLWAAVDVRIKAEGSAWQTDGATELQAVQQVTPVVNRGTTGYGGPW